jgi:hypothetical protein
MEAVAASKLPDDLSDRIERLLEDEEFLKHTGRATADRDAVETRLTRARIVLT